ncbi:hypothetical protein CEUSTIGMA_g8038.t1 [Chlamydomonas eustigma]|uniref:Peptidase C1A papain C-terminal domain-containing protein n=1 Tax=Chlamydomonas eustigma TaxID=1157962 RepID=A0A250XBZ8_9CHLO|nr:hypothetical protein CEUSTIGMA_g8038.t1 [Chlamydomonas eustigma]|eukprot:GAX80603.1 hypothetical protein CEUSTIGMA_g8038.t1 [Chlamydomonas eustigma]
MALSTIVFCAVLLVSVQAGDYGKKNRNLKKPVPLARQAFNPSSAPVTSIEKLPKDFDWGHQPSPTGDGFTSLLQPSWNQHIPQYCGSCYLHATLSMVQDRISVLSHGKSRVMLGRQTFLNCAPLINLSHGCNGGDVPDVLEYMAQKGLPDETCLTYKASDSSILEPPPLGFTKEAHHCPSGAACRNCMPKQDDSGDYTCWSVEAPILYKVTSYGKIAVSDGVAGMMNEIYHRGPITCSVAAENDFTYNYDGSIFSENNFTEDQIDHDVEVVGWGEENGVKFWNVRNSWGTYWGKLGFFRVERGNNAMLMENGDCWYAVPDVHMEEQVEDGEYIGSMDGLKKKKKALLPGATQHVALQEIQSLKETMVANRKVAF